VNTEDILTEGDATIPNVPEEPSVTGGLLAQHNLAKADPAGSSTRQIFLSAAVDRSPDDTDLLVQNATEIFSSIKSHFKNNSPPARSLLTKYVLNLVQAISLFVPASGKSHYIADENSMGRARYALSLLEIAAEKENLDAMYLLGEAYFVPPSGDPTNPVRELLPGKLPCVV
jgi:TPR repeat protein